MCCNLGTRWAMLSEFTVSSSWRIYSISPRYNSICFLYSFSCSNPLFNCCYTHAVLRLPIKTEKAVMFLAETVTYLEVFDVVLDWSVIVPRTVLLLLTRGSQVRTDVHLQSFGYSLCFRIEPPYSCVGRDANHLLFDEKVTSWRTF